MSSAMPQKAEHTVHILEGKATLYKRPTTPYWYVRYKANNQWLRTSTKATKLDEAKSVATDIVTEAWYKAKFNIPVVSKRFKAVANLAINKMQEALNANAGKRVFEDYIMCTRKYLIPFFGNYNIDNISYELTQQFADWRAKKLGRIPSASSINTHNSALNRIFDEALIRGFITKTQIPELRNDGRKNTRRPDFTSKEFQQLHAYLEKWTYKGRKGHEKEMRYLLHDYVLFLAHTGVRAGTEAMNLKWRHLRFKKKDGKDYLLMTVIGKTKEHREITLQHRIAACLNNIRLRTPSLIDMKFEELINAKVDEYIFRDDKRTARNMQTALGNMFKRVLKEANLEIDPRTDMVRTLYSLRHVFATTALTETNLSSHVLSKHMGTSTAMIDKYYGHVDLSNLADEFAGTGSMNDMLPTFKPPKT
jgi:integrase